MAKPANRIQFAKSYAADDTTTVDQINELLTTQAVKNIEVILATPYDIPDTKNGLIFHRLFVVYEVDK